MKGLQLIPTEKLISSLNKEIRSGYYKHYNQLLIKVINIINNMEKIHIVIDNTPKEALLAEPLLSFLNNRINALNSPKDGFTHGIVAGLTMVKEYIEGETKVLSTIHAYWVKHYENDFSCSNCKTYYDGSCIEFVFCPNCGARMSDFKGPYQV